MDKPSSKKLFVLYRVQLLFAISLVLFMGERARGAGEVPLPPDQHPSGGEVFAGFDFQRLNQTHDLVDLPDWGPFSKKYAGISHVAEAKEGIRFDFSVMPGFYRNRVLIPNVNMESGYYPWEANSTLTRLTYRYELEWKDRVFVDATYSVLASNRVLVELRCVNNAKLPQNLALNLMAWLEYPPYWSSVKAHVGSEVSWISGVRYKDLVLAKPRHDNNLVYDGLMRCEALSSDYLDGSAIGKGFGADAGDRVSYTVLLKSPVPAGEIALRYRLNSGAQVDFQIKGLANSRVHFVGTGNFEIMRIPFRSVRGGYSELSFESKGGAAIEFNGFFVETGKIRKGDLVAGRTKVIAPKLVSNDANHLILKYDSVENYYGIAWDFSHSLVREIQNDELDIFFRANVHDHVHQKLIGNGRGFYENVFMRPVEIAENSERTVRAVICSGNLESVEKVLSEFSAAPKKFTPIPESEVANILPEGDKYMFSQKMLRATLMANVVYPVYTQGSFIRHFTPGKWWDSLYTWDSGFIALGLNEVNPALAAQCLNAYTTPAGSQSAFIHHGSMVPVQVYAFWDLWNRTQSRELLVYFYPRLKQYYEFLSGRTTGSTTRTLKSNLLKTWDYFYNSGGWDDYPAQVGVHSQRLEKSTTPVITTAQCIRMAKILRMTAENLSLAEDVRGYDMDIKMFSDALQGRAWDPVSGYFSYVVHDAKGVPTGFLSYGSTGQNYNKGLDGVYPLFAGICTPEQQAILLDKVFSPTNMWTRSGICVVDQSAPYYRSDGYWNAAVWMPHQWFMWKTMLDLGRDDLAWKIAQKGLEIWKTETDESYYTFEHFLAATGRGAGWHQFSALSTPVLAWFSCYFTPGTATVGFEVMIKKQSFGSSNSAYEAELSFDKASAPHSRTMIVCLKPQNNYQARFNGQKLEIKSLHKGLVAVNLPATNLDGVLKITANVEDEK